MKYPVLVIFTMMLSICLLNAPSSIAATSSWQAHYSGDILPDQADPKWTCRGESADVDVQNGILRIDTLDHHSVWFYELQTSFNNSIGFSLEIRMWLKSYPTPGVEGEVIIIICDGTAGLILLIFPGQITEATSGFSHLMTTTDSFHKYEITAKAEDFKIYVDDILQIDGTGKHTFACPSNYIGFGDIVGTEYTGPEGALSWWDYIYAWDSEGSPSAVVGGQTNQIIINTATPHGGNLWAKVAHPILLLIGSLVIAKLTFMRIRRKS